MSFDNIFTAQHVWLLITNNFDLKRKVATLFERITIRQNGKLFIVKNDIVVSLSDFEQQDNHITA